MDTRPTSLRTDDPASDGTIGRFFGYGLVMGLCDLMPGVSSANIALVLGFYERFIAALRDWAAVLGYTARGSLTAARGAFKKVEWRFLIPLLTGEILALFILAGLIDDALQRWPIQMAGLFLGLVLGSATVTAGMLRRWDGSAIAACAVTTLALFAALGLAPVEGAGHHQQASLWQFGVAGALAISAMLLPGISGSFVLVAMGMYSSLLGVIAARDWLPLIVFALGCAVGLAVLSGALHWLLARHYDRVLPVMVGLMLGSTRVLWPWPAGVESTDLVAPTTHVPITIALIVAGAIAVVGLNRLAHRRP